MNELQICKRGRRVREGEMEIEMEEEERKSN